MNHVQINLICYQSVPIVAEINKQTNKIQKKPTPAIKAIVSYFYTSLYSLPIFRALNFDLITLSKFLEVFSEHQWMYI